MTTKTIPAGALRAAQSVLSNCAYKFVHPDGYQGEPQEIINGAIELGAAIIARESGLAEAIEAFHKIGEEASEYDADSLVTLRARLRNVRHLADSSFKRLKGEN